LVDSEIPARYKTSVKDNKKSLYQNFDKNMSINPNNGKDTPIAFNQR